MRAMQSKLTVLLSVLVLTFISAYGQVATGTYASGTFDAKGMDTINVGNLNVHLSIPVLNKAGRGLPFYYNLGYDSSIWTPVSVNGSLVWQPAQEFGWQGDTEIVSGYLGYTQWQNTTGDCSGGQARPPELIVGGGIYHDRYGVAHLFGGEYTENLCTGATTNTIPVSARDGSGYKLPDDGTGHGVPGGPITDRFGHTFAVPVNLPNGSSTVTDTNGNQITTDGNGHFTDTTGQVVLTVAGSAPSAHTFTYTDTGGTSRSVTVSYVTRTVQTNFQCSGVGEYAATSTPLVDKITFPDGTYYQFGYELTPGSSTNYTGRIASIRLPQGGTIHYTYTGGSNGTGIECADGSTSGLTRVLDADSSSDPSSWAYARSSPNGAGTSHTEVVDGLGNHLEYDFVEASSTTVNAYYETQSKVYQGGASGTPLLARTTCYNGTGTATPCTSTTTAPTAAFTEIDTYETLNGTQTHGATTKYDAYGDQTEADIYDFATSATSRGSLLSKQQSTYGYSIAGLPTEVDSYDGSGNQVGKSQYAYDETTPSSSSGVPQHVSVSGARGNLTTAKNYSTSSAYLTSTYTYKDTGSVLTYSGPGAGTTTYGYDSTFVYNTGTTLPTPSSGIALGSSAAYDSSHTGLPTSSTDLNGQTTNFVSYDSMLRLLETDYPVVGKTTMSYTANSTTSETYQSSTVHGTSEVIYDGYGRTSRILVENGQGTNPWYQQDYCYDANGNLKYVSYPYQGTGSGSSKICSGASTGASMTYDALGRPLTVTRSNTESQSYTYSGRATKFVDENGATRISQIDGLGRPTIVCEISSSSLQGGGSPASCGTDISGNGYLSSYAYSVSSGATVTTVTQGVQTRSFKADWLGRTISVTEPETGTASYTYAINSTGLQVVRTKPRANQTSASTTTNTTTQYDLLGRVVSVTYNDGVTPTKTFSYDASASWSNFSQTNLKGRLSMAAVATNGIGAAKTAYTYDAMGRPAGLAECAPSNCGSSYYSTAYTYDWMGDLLSSNDGQGVTESYTYSPAGEVKSITSSINDATHPPDLVSNVQNGPFGPTNWQLGNGLVGVQSYDTLGRVSGGWVCNGSTAASCSGGTEVYGFISAWKGVRLTSSSDTVLAQTSTYGYDEFNRLASRTVTSGTVQNFSWTYDRYGNRWTQTLTAGSGSAPQPDFNFNLNNNQLSVSGYSYDAAGNLISDGNHTYTYDAEGNITAVDNGATAKYTYNALNQRVRIDKSGSPNTSEEFIFNASGQAASARDVVNNWAWSNWIYWGGRRVAFNGDGQANFEHQDWTGTERARTAYNASVEGTFTSLPFGDAQTTASGSDIDPYHYAMLDTDSETGTNHAQFRQYSNLQGRWMSSDPYSGSYDFSNPQSLNRYAYVMNNPLSAVDPSGLDIKIGNCYYQLASTQVGSGPVVFEMWLDYCAGGGSGGDGGGGGVGGGGGGGGGVGDSGNGNAPSNGPTVPFNPCNYAGSAPSPSVYAQKGQAGSSNAFTDIYNLLQFRRGASLDAQVRYGGAPSYANYAFGVYMAAAGYTLNQTLALADIYAQFRSSYPVGTPMAGPNYPFTPQANVSNITNGFNAQTNGTTCHVGG